MRYLRMLGCLLGMSACAGSPPGPDAAMVAAAAGQLWFQVDLTTIGPDTIVGPLIGRGDEVIFEGGVSGMAGRVSWVMFRWTEQGECAWYLQGEHGNARGIIRPIPDNRQYGMSAQRGQPGPAAPGEWLLAYGKDRVSLEDPDLEGFRIAFGPKPSAHEIP